MSLPHNPGIFDFLNSKFYLRKKKIERILKTLEKTEK
jgi:hypothetical protein